MNTKPDSLKRVRIFSPEDLDSPRALRTAANTPQPPLAGASISRRVCVCCGEPMVPLGDAPSRNPNVCASCSSMADGMGEPPSTWIPVPICYQTKTVGGSDEILP